jgi:1-acyl-sn-glycerol-3-phosphate acyltransferase
MQIDGSGAFPLSLTLLVLVLFSVALVVVIWLGLKACEKQANADWGGPWQTRIAGLVTLFCRRYHGLSTELLPLPSQGCALVAANHVSGLDPLLLVAASPRHLRFLIAREEYERFGLKWLFRSVGCIPVDRQGRPEQALREAFRALEEGHVVAIFPHGRIHLDSDPPRPIKGGVIRLAQKANCPLYPVRLDGIRGQGYTFLAIPWRSRVRLCFHPPMACQEHPPEACLARLTAYLETSHDEATSSL